MLRVPESTMNKFLRHPTLVELDVRLRELLCDVAHIRTVLDMQARRIAQMYEPDAATVSYGTRGNMEGELTLCP
jgi:hypothetical protein